ncbi:hypothetical protein ABFS83_08G125800 [Erythranthe nasuta]
MAESWWRARTQTPEYPPRRSTEYGTTSGDNPLIVEDFADVFGGPPRTILSHQFATRFSISSSSSSSRAGTGFFYEDIFRGAEKAAKSVERSGRNLPQFKIPAGNQRSPDLNYQPSRQNGSSIDSDNFGWDDESFVVRSRSRSKTSSSSAFSSDEFSPLRPAISDDASFFAPKLRAGQNSTRTENYQKPQQKSPFFADNNNKPVFNSEKYFFEKSSNCPSAESISHSDCHVSADDLHFTSPSSDASSASHSDTDLERETSEIVHTIWRQDHFMEDEEDEEEEESVYSFINIEINSNNRERTCEPDAIDEAIAWAKQKFHTHCSEEKQTKELVNEDHLPKENKERFQSMIQVEMQIQEMKILLWLTGKQADIRLLLSSLHNILWNNSGWVTISLINITENSQVKKAYQKAQLCLHPDKLQQRGATVPQKYIAEKVFSALQDAWAAFLC